MLLADFSDLKRKEIPQQDNMAVLLIAMCMVMLTQPPCQAR
jgi:hypothetical protein